MNKEVVRVKIEVAVWVGLVYGSTINLGTYHFKVEGYWENICF